MARGRVAPPLARLAPGLRPARSSIVMPVTVNVPAAAVLHPIEPGPLPAIQAAVGPHPGLGRADAPLLKFQAPKFSAGQLPGPHSLVDSSLLVKLPPVDVRPKGPASAGRLHKITTPATTPATMVPVRFFIFGSSASFVKKSSPASSLRLFAQG